MCIYTSKISYLAKQRFYCTDKWFIDFSRNLDDPSLAYKRKFCRIVLLYINCKIN